MRYFIKQYWRYIAMALAFATFNFLINACQVHAETNYNQSLNININETSNSADRILWNDANHTQKAFANAGRGYLVGIILAYKYSENTSFTLPTLYSVNARTDAGYSTCEISSLANNSESSYDDMKASVYGFKCDLTMSTNGLISVSANFAPAPNNTFTIESYRLTFNNNLQAQEVQYEQYIYDYMQNYLYPRLNTLTTTNASILSNLQWIYSYLQNYIYVAQQNTITQLQDINTKLNELMQQNQVCNYYDKNNIEISNKALNRNNGNLFDASNYGITNYIKISKTAKVKIIYTDTTVSAGFCFYNINKEFISCLNIADLVENNYITIPNNTSYIRTTIRKTTNRPQFEICDTSQNMINQQNQELNDNITSDDTTGGNSQANDFFDNFDSGSTGSLMDIVSLPLDFLDSLNNTCQPIQITIPYFDETYNLPCLRTYLNGKFPNIVTLITLLINGILCYRILKAFVDLVNKLKDPNNNDIEVMDL